MHFKNKAKDGTFFWVRTTIGPFIEGERKPNQYLVMQTDITESQTIKEALCESEALNKAIISSLSVHITVIDKSGSIITTNKAWDDFAKANAVISPKSVSAGANYFDVCKKALQSGDVSAGIVLKGLQSVFNKEKETFELEYPCHAPHEERWFILRVSNLENDGARVVISHQNITERKKAEQKLVLSESGLNEAQAIAKMGSWETDLQTLKIIWSKECHHIFETDPQNFQVTYAAFREFVHPEDRAKSDAAFSDSIFDGVASIEHRIITAKGHNKFVLENWKVHFNEAGLPVRAVGTCQDITERKLTENKLNATSTELKTAVTDLNKILDSSLDVVCTINGNGEFVTVSVASQQVWGYTPEELIGNKFMNFVYDEDVDRTSKAAEKIVNNIQVPTFENRYVHKNGRVVHILWSVNWDEKLQLMFCIAKDVTEKKRLEKTIENERDRFSEMFLSVPASMAILEGPDHIYQMANEQYLNLTNRKNIIGKTVKEVFPEIESQGILDVLDKVYKTGEAFIANEQLIKLKISGTQDLKEVYLNFVYQAYHNEQNEIEGIFVFVIDITEQEKAKENLIATSERLLLATTSAKMGIWDWDIVSDKMIWDDRMFELYGIGNEHFTGAVSVWQNGVHPDDIERAGKELNDAITGKGDFNSEFRVKLSEKQLNGEWINYGRKENPSIAFHADYNIASRFSSTHKPEVNVSGRWEAWFDADTPDSSIAIGVFK
ncbi:MAG: PAS domain S-box protein, partial [Sediminibacterium sp.]